MTQDLTAWIGRTETRRDAIDTGPVRRMAATLGVAPPDDTLPPLWLWLFHLDAAPPEALGRDGHPKKGGFLPPVALPRRMWAGGAFSIHAPITLGAHVEKHSTIADIVEKEGRSGPLCFVTVLHDYRVNGASAVEERHDIVYRADPDPDAAPTPPPMPVAADTEVEITTTTLFRYSALTFNGHRIHYDRDYARDVEGYPDLVVHGPLIATLLAAHLAEATDQRMTRFSYRAVSPVCGAGPVSLARRRTDGNWTACAGARGTLAMTAEAEFATRPEAPKPAEL